MRRAPSAVLIFVSPFRETGKFGRPKRKRRKQLITKNGNGRFDANDLSFDKYFATLCRLSAHCGGVFAAPAFLRKILSFSHFSFPPRQGICSADGKGIVRSYFSRFSSSDGRRSRENSKYARRSALVWTGSKGVFSKPSIVRVLGGNATAAKKQGGQKKSLFPFVEAFFQQYGQLLFFPFVQAGQ